jgi:hypothetical protein
MTYDAQIDSYDDHNPPRPIERHIQQPPSAALEIDGVWLLGGNRGEWGGELIAIDRAGQKLVLDDNIHLIARFGQRIVALAGLAHLFSNRGMIYELARAPDDAWQARPWRVLPGMPLASLPQSDGSWLISTHGGTVVLSIDGVLKMASCEQIGRIARWPNSQN